MVGCLRRFFPFVHQKKIVFFWILMFVPIIAHSQVVLPQVNLGFKSVDNPTELVSVLRIIFVLTVLSLAPAILILMTSFTRIVIVLSFVRQAIGVQQLPPNQLLIGIALFLTFFLMKPTFEEVHRTAIEPLMAGQLKAEQAMELGAKPLRKFMFAQTRADDLNLFIKLANRGGNATPKTLAEVSTLTLIPAFVLSELKTAFQMGFLLFLPFLIIDIVVSSVLMAMGMMMLPPVMISLPLKVMLFVLVDGWTLIFGSLIKSFGEM